MKALSPIQKSETINRHMGLQEWGLIIILSIIWGGSFFFVGIAVKEIPPFLTRDERLTNNRMTGVLIGWIGVAVLIGFESLRGFGIEVIGQIAVLGAAFSYACAAIYGRRFKGLSPLVVATGMLCGSTIMMTPLALFVEQP
jgi:drug/metabolite transporter (DMT)-like permease